MALESISSFQSSRSRHARRHCETILYGFLRPIPWNFPLFSPSYYCCLLLLLNSILKPSTPSEQTFPCSNSCLKASRLQAVAPKTANRLGEDVCCLCDRALDFGQIYGSLVPTHPHQHQVVSFDEIFRRKCLKACTHISMDGFS